MLAAMGRRRIASTGSLAALVALAALAAPAVAQPAGEGGAPAAAAPAKDPKAVKKWQLAGQQLVGKGDAHARARRADEAKASYANAVTAFEKALEAGGEADTHALLADALDKLGKLDLAVKHYRIAVRAGAGLRPEVLKKATARLDDLMMQVGIVTLTVRPEGALITLSGALVGKAPLAEPFVLLPGTYTVGLQAEGFQPREVELNVEAGSESERTIELEAMKLVVAPLPPPAPPPVAPPPPPPSRLPLYVGGAAGGTLLGVATVTGLLALGRHGTYTAGDSTPDERADARASGQTLARVTDLALVGGLAAGGFTAYWYFVKYRPALQKGAERRSAASRGRRERQDAAQSTKVEVIPWVQSAASGLTLVGAF
jgi:hypothetical protein